MEDDPATILKQWKAIQEESKNFKQDRDWGGDFFKPNFSEIKERFEKIYDIIDGLDAKKNQKWLNFVIQHLEENMTEEEAVDAAKKDVESE